MLNRENNNNLNDLLADMDPLASKKPAAKAQNPAAFLGENSALVNLDNLIKPINPTSNNNAYNPFSDSPAMKRNLFQQNQPQVRMSSQKALVRPYVTSYNLFWFHNRIRP